MRTADEVIDHLEFRKLVARELGGDVLVEVTEWAGCDEDWVDPIYVTAECPGREFYDAVCDLGSDASVESQVEYVVEQLIKG